MENTVAAAEVKSRLETLLDHAHKDEPWMIVRPDGKTVAKRVIRPADGLVAIEDHAALIGLMKGRIGLSSDFDEPLEDFKPYTE